MRPGDRRAPELRQLPGVNRVIPAGSGQRGLQHELTGLALLPVGLRGQDDLRPAVFNAAKQRHWILQELHSERKNLEDILPR